MAKLVFLQRTQREIELFGGDVFFDIDGKNVGKLSLSNQIIELPAGTHSIKMYKSHSDEYCQGVFSNGTVNTLRTSRICKDFQEKQAQNQARKINACRIHEVSAVCAYGLHRSAIRGAVPLVRGFA